MGVDINQAWEDKEVRGVNYEFIASFPQSRSDFGDQSIRDAHALVALKFMPMKNRAISDQHLTVFGRIDSNI
jgi:hypothetical protein